MKVNGADSESTAVLSGIPQGSVLGPSLFVIYINDLPEADTSDALLFADDTKLYLQITSREDAHILQCDLDSLRDWSEKWLPKFSFSFLDCQLFKKLYITFVRPHLDYAQAVWAPHLSKHINMIENMQIRATKLVDGLGGLDYTKRQKKLDLPKLAYRRAGGDMIELFKHFHAYDKATLPLSFQPRNRISRKHNFQLVWKLPKDGTRGLQANSFYYRTTQIRNNLPQVVSSTRWNINSIKNMLDKTWTNNPLKDDHTIR